MDYSVSAHANAINMEVKKDGLSQRQNGDWQLRFTVASIDMDQRLTSAPMGTRFVAVLVELNDDETPVDRAAIARDKWREKAPAQQAGIRCTDPVFWAFLEERGCVANNHDEAASVVRELCGVASRGDFNKPGFNLARTKWYDLDFAFQAWRVKENA